MKIAKIANLDFKELIETVYNAFADSKCLFIFDNVEDFIGENGLAQFLPSGIIRKPFLLLTSRRNDLFSTNRILRLDVLSQSDSIDLVQKHIPGATNEIADKLAERLDRVPLVIHQAIAYIKKLLPLQSSSFKDVVFKSMNSFLEEYECNSNRILNNSFSAADRYAKNVFLICEISLRKLEHEEGGKLAKQMLRYISFLHSDDIQVEFLFQLLCQYESPLGILGRIMSWSAEIATDPNITVNLLCSYSLIDINPTQNTIKVHRLVQDATRFMLTQSEEFCYVKRLIDGLNSQECGQRISHWVSITRACRIKASKRYLNM